MYPYTSKQQKIISLLLRHQPMASSAVYAGLTEQREKVSLVTVKRELPANWTR